MRRYSVFIVLLLCFLTSWSQDVLTVKYFGLTVHPFGDKTAHLQPNKLDENARFVINYGVFIGLEKFVYEDLVSVKAIQGVMADCSNGLASVSHFGIRGALLQSRKHRVYVGIGPTLIVRDSWTRFGSSYESSGFFNETYNERLGDLQWKMVPYGLEFEYDYVFTPKNQLSVSFTPGIPLATIFSIGWKHWFKVKEYDPFKLYMTRGKKST